MQTHICLHAARPLSQNRPAALLSTLLLLTVASLGGCNRQPDAGFAQASTSNNPSPSPSAPAPGLAAPANSRLPSIVIYLVDTLRADRLGAYGHSKRPLTPTMDALAGRGVVFEQAYGAGPWTVPSVASLFTSRFCSEHSHIMMRSKLDEKLTVIAQVFERGNYMTCSLFTNSFLLEEFGMARGFHTSGGLPWIDQEKLGFVFDKVFRAPLLLYVHNLEPHTPWNFLQEGVSVPGFQLIEGAARQKIKDAYLKYKELLAADYSADQPFGTTDVGDGIAAQIDILNGSRDAYNDLYDAAVGVADAHLAGVIEELKHRGIWDNTILILTSDHGEELGEHGGWLHGQALYDEQIRVPLIIHFPHDRFAGTRIAAPVSLVDVAPTTLALAGAPPTAEFHGRNLLPLIMGEVRAPEDAPVVVSVRRNQTDYYKPWHEKRGETNFAARMDQWKAIWNADPQTLELYDLQADPGETQNLADANPQVAQKLRDFLVKFQQRCAATALPVKTIAHPKSETKDRLKSIGYVE